MFRGKRVKFPAHEKAFHSTGNGSSFEEEIDYRHTASFTQRIEAFQSGVP